MFFTNDIRALIKDAKNIFLFLRPASYNFDHLYKLHKENKYAAASLMLVVILNLTESEGMKILFPFMLKYSVPNFFIWSLLMSKKMQHRTSCLLMHL